MVFDRDDVAHAILERFEIALDVEVDVDRARVGHRVFLENPHVLDLEELSGDRREQDPAVDVRLLAQLARLDLVELILKAFQPLYFGIDREPAIIADLAIVLVQAEGDTLKWSGCQVAADKVEHQLVEIGVRLSVSRPTRRKPGVAMTRESASITIRQRSDFIGLA